ncbi:hypothetical protein Hdeb2414_s0023g00624191 [Helianthus debilis subsp. tardiflorus]
MRLKRIPVDYMLRMPYYATATKLAERSNIQVIKVWLNRNLLLSFTYKLSGKREVGAQVLIHPLALIDNRVGIWCGVVVN